MGQAGELVVFMLTFVLGSSRKAIPRLFSGVGDDRAVFCDAFITQWVVHSSLLLAVKAPSNFFSAYAAKKRCRVCRSPWH